MQAVHDLFDGCMQVPVVEVQDVDIRRPQLLKARLNAELEILEVVTNVVHALLERLVPGSEVVRVLCTSTNEQCGGEYASGVIPWLKG